MIRVLLVDDHPVVRAGLRFALDTQEDLCVVGEAVDGAEALGLAEAMRPDKVGKFPVDGAVGRVI